MKPRILIVEDEPAIVDTIQYALETEGFETVCLDAGGPVLDLLTEERIDLILLDIGLPDINGIELCKEIRTFSPVPVIFLTARSDEVDRVVGLEIGGDDYVTKPFSPRELTARVKAVLRRARPSAPSEASPPAFAVVEAKRQIRFFGEPLPLSKHEYNLLKVLISRPGAVFSRDRLMDLAWEEPEASMDRTVDAHIKNIRAKLKAVREDADPIVTHRGVGYSLKEDL